MPQLHETGYGRRLFEHDLPEIHRQLSRVADVLEKVVIELRELKKEKKKDEKND